MMAFQNSLRRLLRIVRQANSIAAPLRNALTCAIVQARPARPHLFVSNMVGDFGGKLKHISPSRFRGGGAE